MNPVKNILGKDVNKNRTNADTCKLCGLKVGKHNVYGKKGCSECAYLNEE